MSTKVERKFIVGDRVRWFSQAQGGYTTKAGCIVEILAPGDVPTTVKDSGMGRNHESYVVAVDAITDWTKKTRTLQTPKHYWPRVSGLEWTRRDE